MKFLLLEAALTHRVGFISRALRLRELYSDMILKTIQSIRSNLSHERISWSPSVVPGGDKFTTPNQIQQYVFIQLKIDE